jgi:8-hydroxy-5-deazaflavin:NADPH oxidoreductase
MTTPKIAVIGGTGPQGKGLAYRFAAAGHHVIIGSRSADRAVEAAQEIGSRLGKQTPLAYSENNAAAKRSEIVVLAVPFDGHADLVHSLRPHLTGKTVISCVNPLGFDKSGPYGLDVTDGSAAEQAQRIASEADVVGAFHHLSARTLWSRDALLDDEDVLVCGDNADAKAAAIELARSITGRPGIDAGPLRLARQLEPLTAVLLSVNKRYKAHAGIRVTGLNHA